MYRIYIYHDVAHFRESDFEKACAILSQARIEKAKAYFHAKDRNQSVITALLLQFALRDAYSITEKPVMRYGQYGKPMLQGENMPYFNISHCDLAVACAVSDQSIGIDVEPYASYSDEVANEVCNESEFAYVKNKPDRFAELWTRKESFMKYKGNGLVDDVKTLMSEADSLYFNTFHFLHGYACTVCSPEVSGVEPCIVEKDQLLL